MKRKFHKKHITFKTPSSGKKALSESSTFTQEIRNVETIVSEESYSPIRLSLLISTLNISEDRAILLIKKELGDDIEFHQKLSYEQYCLLMRTYCNDGKTKVLSGFLRNKNNRMAYYDDTKSRNRKKETLKPINKNCSGKSKLPLNLKKQKTHKIQNPKPQTSNKSISNKSYTEKNNNASYRYCSITIDDIVFNNGFYAINIPKDKCTKTLQPLYITDSHAKKLYNSNEFRQYFTYRLSAEFNYIICYSGQQVIGMKNKFDFCQFFQIAFSEFNKTQDDLRLQEQKKILSSHQGYYTQKQLISNPFLQNRFVDYLLGLQSTDHLISLVTEQIGECLETSLVFTIRIDNDRIALVYENIKENTNRATEVFITNKKHREECLSMIIKYFQNNATCKRTNLRNKKSNPKDFKAIEYHAINHDKDTTIWCTWLQDRINDKKNTHKTFHFTPSYVIPKDIDKRKMPNAEIHVTSMHNTLMTKLYDYLSEKYGKENVATEVRLSTNKRIDILVRNNNLYDIYEIKTDKDPLICFKEAFGQIMLYAYLLPDINIGSKIIVGPSKTNEDFERYIEATCCGVKYMQIPD